MPTGPDSAAGLPGWFIAFEGGEGAGKSTQSRRLAAWLREAGHEVVQTREPGDTPAAEAMRAILLGREYAGLGSRTEALLFAAARADHVERVVRPALERGAVVVCDRYLDSSLAYQGVGRELGVEAVRQVNDWGTGALMPHLTVLLDIDPEVGLPRARADDRLEREPLDFHRAVAQAFRELASAAPDRYLVLSATAPTDEVATAIRDRVDRLLGGNG